LFLLSFLKTFEAKYNIVPKEIIRIVIIIVFNLIPIGTLIFFKKNS